MIRHSTTPHQNTSTKEGFDRKSNEVLTGSIARNECARRCSIDRNQAFDRSSNQSINRSIDRSAIAGSDLRAIDRSVGACVLVCSAFSARSLAALHLPHHRLLHISLALSCALLFVSLVFLCACIVQCSHALVRCVREYAHCRLVLASSSPTSRYYWVLGVCRSIDRTHADLSIGSVSVFVRALAPCFPARSRFSALTTSHTHASTFLSASTSSRRASASPTP